MDHIDRAGLQRVGAGARFCRCAAGRARVRDAFSDAMYQLVTVPEIHATGINIKEALDVHSAIMRWRGVSQRGQPLFGDIYNPARRLCAKGVQIIQRCAARTPDQHLSGMCGPM